VADYVKTIYAHDDETLWVNLYTPSDVRWDRPDGAVEIAQETGYPATDAGTVTIRKGGGEFAVNLRIPHWTEGARVTVNGQPVAVTPGAYAAIRRRWKAGDTIAWHIPQPLRTLPIDDRNPDRVAVMRGPVMYVGLDPWEGLYDQPVALPGALKPVAGQDEAYVASVGGKDLVFQPFFAVQQQRYNTYFRKA
jgi:uncharacterized protein